MTDASDEDRTDPQFPDAASRHVLDPGCARCPALVESRTRISWGTGPSDAEVMVVGEAPGAGNPDADRWQGGNHTGMAYTTRHSGRRVRELFARLGYDPYYTNAVKCFPEGDGGTNREPTGEERTNCRSHLARELVRVEPSVVVATGKHATTTMLAFEGEEMDGFVERVLAPERLPSLGVDLLPILHPSYQDVWVSRLGYGGGEYEKELGRILTSLVPEGARTRDPAE